MAPKILAVKLKLGEQAMTVYVTGAAGVRAIDYRWYFPRGPAHVPPASWTLGPLAEYAEVTGPQIVRAPG